MSHKVTITFNPSVVDATHDAPTEYEIKRASTPTGTFATVASLSASGPFSFFDTDVKAGESRSYISTAKNETGESAPSNEVTVLIPFLIPGAPSSLAAVAV
jgi:hypothetical protein